MAQKLSITSIEFEDIKTSLKEYLRSQNTFKDYDFEGSALSILIELLAYNTYYTAFYTNMVANEMTLATAAVRDSIVAHAKSLNYIPTSRRGARANVSVLVTPPANTAQASLTIDRFTPFESEAIDGVNYTFVTPTSYTAYQENGAFPFNTIQLVEGTPQTSTFTYDPLTNSTSEFEIPDNTIDTSTLSVIVQASSINTVSQVFTLSTDITALTSNSAAFFLSMTANNTYKLVFGDGRVSQALSNGNIIIATYLTCQGEGANKANAFATGSIGGFSNVIVTGVSAAAGGSERETDDSIKFNAPIAYSAQNRAVTINDYAVLLQKLYPNFKSVSVWGGEDNLPPVYDTVFITYIPKDGVIINDTEKQRILKTIIKPLSVVTVTPVVVDPDFIYLEFNTSIEVDQKATVLTSTEITSLVKAAILQYTNSTLNTFNSTFSSSKLSSAIDGALGAITGSDTITIVEKRVTPTLNVAKTYDIFFNMPLQRSTFSSGMKTEGFFVFDSLNIKRLAYIEEVFDSSTGIDEIQITNAGFGYFSAPDVTITGDGTGATAVATIRNGSVVSIDVTNRGTNYTTATVTISGGGGLRAAASAVISSRFGTCQLFYIKSNGEKAVLNPNVGTINYETGQITIENLKVVGVEDPDGLISFRIQPEKSLISTTRNMVLTQDPSDPKSMVINVTMK